MNNSAYICAIASSIYIFFAFYGLKLDAKAKLNRTYALICLNFAIWTFSTAFFCTADSPNDLMYWLRFSSFNWSNIPGAALFFALLLTEKPIAKKPWLPFVLFLPGLIFGYKSFTSTLVTCGFVHRLDGWQTLIPTYSPWYWGFEIYWCTFLACTIIIIAAWGFKSTRLREKKIARILTYTSLASLLSNLFIDTFLNVLSTFIYVPPSAFKIFPPSCCTGLFWIYGMFLTITKYRLLVLTPAVASDEIIAKMSDLVFLVNEKGTIIKVGPFAAGVLQYREKELLSEPITLVVDEIDDIFSPQAHTPNYTAFYENSFRMKTGERIPVALSVARINDPTGEQIGFVLIGHDLRETKQLENEICERILAQDELRTLNEELEEIVKQRTKALSEANEEKNRLLQEQIDILKQNEVYKNEFLSIISHELRTPLNFITGFCGLLEKEIAGPLNEEQHKYTDKIMHGADRMLGLVENLLDASSMASGHFQISPTEVVFPTLLEEVIKGYEPQAEKMQLELSSTISALPTIQADPQRIIQVLSNLIGNAIKFTNPGGKVDVKAFVEGSFIKTEVSDTGIGISEDDIPKIFEKFRQLNMSMTRTAGGSGLGLSISKSIVEAHGGTIGIESIVDKGSTFWFTLPLPSAPSHQ